MLKQLRLKNWRSVRDATIDFDTPITVLIGANSSGKTNVLDALRFLQYSHTAGNRGIVGAVRYKWGGKEKIHTLGVPWEEPTEIGFTFQPHRDRDKLIDWMSSLRFYSSDNPFLELHRLVKYGAVKLEDEKIDLPILPGFSQPFAFWEGDEEDLHMTIGRFMGIFITRRWQIFKEFFVPQFNLPTSESDSGDLYLVEENGRNIPYILDTIRLQQPDLYTQLQEDISWLLEHVKNVDTKFVENEMSVSVREKAHDGIEAPTVSAGTARLIAMLAAVYALDMETSRVESFSGKKFEDWTVPINTMPGLVVIEEPDTALNPGLLSAFVGQLRTYTERESPRQFILTTHNPAFLDLFEPEEVRIVERDEQGYTTVKPVPGYIREIWLEKYGLGEVWTTNAFGGLPE